MSVFKIIVLIIKRLVFILFRWGKVCYLVFLLSLVGCFERVRVYYYDYFVNGVCIRVGLNFSFIKISCLSI